MVYKVEVTKKDNLSEIRYIGDNISSLKKLISIDMFRDIANYIMKNNPSITYDQAYKSAKEFNNKENTNNSTENTNNLERAKVKVYSMNNGIKLSEGDIVEG